MIRPYTAETILHSLHESYVMLYEKYGTKPNRFLISREYITVLKNDLRGELNRELNIKIGGTTDFEMYIWGVKVIVVEELHTAKAAIILEE